MARSTRKGPVFGNYVTLLLTPRVATGTGQTNVIVDRIPLPADFRPVHVSFGSVTSPGLGLTANASANVTNDALVTGTGTVDLDIAATVRVSASTLVTNSFTQVNQGDALVLRVTTDGTGLVPAGAITAHVTGFFTRPITIARYQESGQSTFAGPAAGFYDCLTLRNTIPETGPIGQTVVGNIQLPYNCRVMAVTYNSVGITRSGTPVILALIRNNTAGVDIHTTLDIAAMSNDLARIDAITTPALTAGNRNCSRGDVLQLRLQTAVGDIVPMAALTANVWVWVTGHADFAGIANQSVYHPTSVAGPSTGGTVVLPFINKRAANPTKRVEDSCYFPMAARLVAISTSKQVVQVNTSRQLDVGSVQMVTAYFTSSYILHNEGTTLGAYTGNVVGVGAFTRDDDSPLRQQLTQVTYQYALTGSGDLIYATTYHVLMCSRGHFYVDPAND